jgi:hypothetical protein
LEPAQVTKRNSEELPITARALDIVCSSHTHLE